MSLVCVSASTRVANSPFTDLQRTSKQKADHYKMTIRDIIREKLSA
jgi:hypothetical protein